MNKINVLKKSLAAILVGLMVVGIAACSSLPVAPSATEATKAPEPAEVASGDAVTLEFQQWWGVELPAGALDGICQDFTAKTGIKIDVLSNPYADTKTQIAAGAAAGTMADVVGLDGSWVYDFAKQGSIANLTTLMVADGYDSTQLSDQIKYKGDAYMIPVVNFAYPLYMNTDILAKAGVAEAPTTWTEFLGACEKITTNTDAAAYAVPLSTEAPNGIQNQFMSWLWASGGTMLKDGKPNLVGNTQLAELTDFMKEMYVKGYLSDGVEAMKEQDMVNEFLNGRLAFMVDGISHLNLIKSESPDLNFAFSPMPVQDGYTGKSGNSVASWGIGIAENCENKAEAMQFIEYLMSPEVNAKLAQLANAFPGNNKAQPDYSANDERFMTAFNMFNAGYAINEFTGAPTSEDLMRSFNGELVQYISGDIASAADMLTAAQEAWAPAFQD